MSWPPWSKIKLITDQRLWISLTLYFNIYIWGMEKLVSFQVTSQGGSYKKIIVYPEWFEVEPKLGVCVCVISSLMIGADVLNRSVA